MKGIFTKSFFIVALFLLSTVGLLAKTVNVDEAKNIAHQFLTSNLKGSAPEKMKRVSPKASLSLAYESKAQNGNSNLFVFNQGEQGFVVVAGDDRVSPILGYADAGAFDEGNMPEGFRYWLESCSRYVEKAVAGEVKREDLSVMRAESRSYAAYIDPLLGDINFGQDVPYNSQCPMIDGERSIVGCVAVSMGQIMTYYQWPKEGKGSHSYVTFTDSINVSASFNTTYDWKNILHYYDYEDVNYNSTQKNAVAKMLFHCGVSVDMNYGVDGSGSSDIYVPKALSEYFSYDKGMQLHYRAMYNFNDWKNLIKEELNNNRPIIYCGDSEEGGHAFNCDGYDRNDYFHINWGWYGYYNGYYDLRYLDYEEDESTAYSSGHSIVTGIKPDKGDGTGTKTELAHNLMLTYGARISDNVITYRVFNMGGGTFVGDIATGVYYEGELVHKYIHYSDVQCDPGYGDSNVSQDVSVWTVDYYEVQPIYRESGSSEWKPIPGENGMLSRWVYYNGAWTYWTADVPQFRVNSLKAIGDLNSDEAPVFELNFTNTSDFDYYGDVCLVISDDENLTNDQHSIYTHVVALSQETQTVQISFPDALEKGEYYITPWVDMKNGRIRRMFDENGDGYSSVITIVDGSGSSTSGPKLELYDYSSINKKDFVFGEELEYTVYIYNSGEAGYVNLSIDVCSESEWLFALAYSFYEWISKGYNTVTLKGKLIESEDFPAGDYYVKIWDNGDNFGVIKPNYYNEVSFSVRDEEEQSYPSFELVGDMKLNKTAFARGETIKAVYTIRNISDIDYYLDLGISIGNISENYSHTDLTNTRRVYFPANSEKEITSTVVVPSDFEYGEYRIFAYYYDDWSGNDAGYKFFIPVEYNLKHITVEEFEGQYEIEVTSKNDDGVALGSGRYEYGSEVTIAAIPDYGYKFYRWSDKNKENPRVVTVEGDATYEAEFRAITLSLEAQPNDEAFEFVEWSDGETDNPREISIADGDELEYVAIFRMKESAIENAYITSAHVYANSGYLYVVGAEDDYLVFDEVGKLVYLGDETSVQLPSGVYLVRLGKEVQKVVVL